MHNQYRQMSFGIKGNVGQTWCRGNIGQLKDSIENYSLHILQSYPGHKFHSLRENSQNRFQSLRSNQINIINKKQYCRKCSLRKLNHMENKVMKSLNNNHLSTANKLYLRNISHMHLMFQLHTKYKHLEQQYPNNIHSDIMNTLLCYFDIFGNLHKVKSKGRMLSLIAADSRHYIVHNVKNLNNAHNLQGSCGMSNKERH